MNFIIDTHIFLWALSEPNKLSKSQLEYLQAGYNTIYLSAISIAEVAIKASVGKLTIDFDAAEVAERSGFELLDFTAKDALLLKELPFHHKDPFDRMLIVQSLQNGIPVMTNDPKFNRYDCKLVGC